MVVVAVVLIELMGGVVVAEEPIVAGDKPDNEKDVHGTLQHVGAAVAHRVEIDEAIGLLGRSSQDVAMSGRMTKLELAVVVLVAQALLVVMMTARRVEGLGHLGRRVARMTIATRAFVQLAVRRGRGERRRRAAPLQLLVADA